MGAGVEWWATALIAFGASLTGALLGAGGAAVLGARQRRRTARADILTAHLPRLHNLVAAATKGVADVGEPRGHGEEISEAFQLLDRFAAAASRADYGQVHDPIWAWLLKIDEFNASYAKTSGDPNRALAARSIAARQLREWEALNDHLAGYREWLIADLGRWW